MPAHVIGSDADVLAADLVHEHLQAARAAGREPVLGVATGSSPVRIYAELARRTASGPHSWADTWVFALDEYRGLATDHPASYAAFVERHVTRPLGIDPRRVAVPDAMAADPAAECRRFERVIRDRPVDVQILGIGSNGHIAFNEPGSVVDSRCRVVQLDAQTRQDNARFFGTIDEVPTEALTQGISTILRARALVVIAQGAAKAAAVRDAVEGPRSSACPASFLRDHPRVTWLIDEAAAAALAGAVSPAGRPG